MNRSKSLAQKGELSLHLPDRPGARVIAYHDNLQRGSRFEKERPSYVFKKSQISWTE